MTDRVTALLGAISALREAQPALCALVRASTGCSEDAARWCVQGVLEKYTPDALKSLCDTRWEGRVVTVILAATVPLAPLRAVVLPLLQGAQRVRVKPSRRRPELAVMVVEALAAQGLAIEIGALGDTDALIAYGRDETLDALAASLTPGVAFEGHGHGFGAALLSRWDEPTAHALARDIAAYDQHGCLSPQVVLCVDDARGLAVALHHALEALAAQWPRAPMGDDVGAAALQWLGVQAALGAEVLRAPSHAVTLWSRGVMQASPGARHVAVVPVRDLDEARALLAPQARWLSNVGTDLARDLRWRPEGFTGRVSALGAMQDPPLDGPEDPRPPLTPR